MNSSRLALAIATGASLVSLGFIMVDYSFHHSHVTPFFLYFWMVIYFLFAMAVMFCADATFQIATGAWGSPSRTVRYYFKRIGGWAMSALVIWLAFWHQHVFLWIVFALTLIVVFWILFNPARLWRAVHSPHTQ
jgi:hypothetical protein